MGDDNKPSTDVLVDSDSDSDYPKPISQKSDKDSTDANVTEQNTDHVAEQEKSDIAESTDSLETKKNGDFHDKITSEANIVAEEIECKKSEMDKTAEEENSKESIEENKKPEISEEMKVAESADFLNLMKTQKVDKSNVDEETSNTEEIVINDKEKSSTEHDEAEKKSSRKASAKSSRKSSAKS